MIKPPIPSAAAGLGNWEAAPPRTAFPLGKGSGCRCGSNSISSYRLSSNEHFALDVRRRSDGSPGPRAAPGETFGSGKAVRLPPCADCCGWQRPPRSGTAELRVSVLDVNDNAPAFQQSSYRISVLETRQPASLLIQLNASDPDLGPSRQRHLFFQWSHP